ncbi:MAG: 50S ribosomal protein L10 [Dehalococcoidia bacterium]|nr:50S ribosomal protein L10 [Dehalococcoidia bacterium]
MAGPAARTGGDTDAPRGACAPCRALPASAAEGVFVPASAGRTHRETGGAVATERKVAQVEELKALIADAEIAISTAYQGTSVADQVELRAALSQAGAQMRVVKNTLLRLAAQQAGLEHFAELAEGPTAIVVGRDEPLSAAKALTEYMRAHPNLPVQIRRAVVGGQVVDEAYVRDLASVPPRDELLSRIAGGLVGQLTQLMLLLQATTREFAGLVEARAAQLDAEGSAG